MTGARAVCPVCGQPVTLRTETRRYDRKLQPLTEPGTDDPDGYITQSVSVDAAFDHMADAHPAEYEVAVIEQFGQAVHLPW